MPMQSPDYVGAIAEAAKFGPDEAKNRPACVQSKFAFDAGAVPASIAGIPVKYSVMYF